MAVTEKEVTEVLKNIYDPEIHLSIQDLGLVYGTAIEPDGQGGDRINVRMTLTTPACPYGPAMLSQVHSQLSALPGVSEVNVDLVWIPPWDPRTMASDEAKLKMGMFELDDDELAEESAGDPSPESKK